MADIELRGIEDAASEAVEQAEQADDGLENEVSVEIADSQEAPEGEEGQEETTHHETGACLVPASTRGGRGGVGSPGGGGRLRRHGHAPSLGVPTTGAAPPVPRHGAPVRRGGSGFGVPAGSPACCARAR